MKKTKSQLKLLLAALLCAFVVYSKGQTVWNKTYIADRQTMLFGSVLAMDSGYIVTGVTNSAVNSNAKTLLGHIDLTGNLTEYKAIRDFAGDANGVFTNSMIRTSDGRIAFSGQSSSTTGYLFFGLADTNFNSISVFDYNTPNSANYYGYSLLQDGNSYYVAGMRFDSLAYTSDVLLMKIDSAGHRLWEKYYNQSVADRAWSIIKLQNGHLMLGCETNNIDQIHERAHTWLLEVDTNGLMVRQWVDPNDSTHAAQGLKQTQDGGFIFGSQKKSGDFGGGTVAVYSTIVKMDSSFNKQWTFTEGEGILSIYTGINDIEELSDGSFIAAGNNTYYGIDSALNGCIVKLSATGQVIWNKEYRGINLSQTLNFLTDIDVLPDGNLIAVGQCQQIGHTPPQVGWILKLDANGCEMDSCLTTDISQSEIRHPKFAIFPNPASDQVFIEATTTTQAELSIADELGRVLYTNPHFDGATTIKVNNWMNGIYFYRLRTSGNEQQSGKIVVQH